MKIYRDYQLINHYYDNISFVKIVRIVNTYEFVHVSKRKSHYVSMIYTCISISTRNCVKDSLQAWRSFAGAGKSLARVFWSRWDPSIFTDKRHHVEKISSNEVSLRRKRCGRKSNRFRVEFVKEMYICVQ